MEIIHQLTWGWFFAHMTWGMSCLTVFQVYISGNKHRHAWSVGMVNQVLWTVWILSDLDRNMGLAPMNAALWVVFIRNHFKWMKEEQQQSDTTQDDQRAAKILDCMVYHLGEVRS